MAAQADMAAAPPVVARGVTGMRQAATDARKGTMWKAAAPRKGRVNAPDAGA